VVADGVLISVVDDDESMRKAIKRLIQSIGIIVEDFASAEDFLSNGRCHAYACVILDVRLPGLSGLDLQRQLVASNSRLPIIFMSGHGDGLVRAQALECGAIDFLLKPFSEQALFNAINSSLARHNGQGSDTSD
jgi:FixJ family two-component response regulator